MRFRGFLKRRRASARGQVTILFALVFTFMFILFAFVVDFAHLINTKMNLQNAADAAAYAGAAWQARSLNRLAQVNYHIRQDVKELAMRVQVTHLRHNRGFPRGDDSEGPPNVEPFICQQAHGYRAISGLRYANDTNLCRNASPSVGGLPPIVVPPVIASFDPFAVAIASQIRKIAEAANQECRAAAEDNKVLAQHLINVYTQRSQFHANQMQQIAQFLNDTGGGEVADDDSHPIRKVAKESARRNLSLANRDEFQLEIIPPRGGQYIRLINETMRASLFFINFNVVGDGCVGRPSFVDFDGMVSNVHKDVPIITYFAVRLKSKPVMLFMPQAWVGAFPQLEAYAAAKPFGGRIGPDATADRLTPVANRPGNNNRQINFSFKPGDNLGIMNKRIMSLLDRLHPFNGAGRPDGNRDTGWPEPDKGDDLKVALQAIRAPTIFESVLYSAWPDPGGNADNDYLEKQFALNMYPDYLEAAGPDNQIIDTPTPKTPPYMNVNSKNKGSGWLQVNADAQGGGPYGNYATEQPASHSVVLGPNIGAIGGKAAELGWANRDQIHSGWAPAGRAGRLGYSVKFIGFDSLMRTMRVRVNDSGALGPISNPPDSSNVPNLENIYH